MSSVISHNEFLFKLQLIDYRVEFSKWWKNEFKNIKFPAQGTVFNYYIDHETKKFNSWNNLVKNFELDYDIPLQVRIHYILSYCLFI